MIEVDHIKVERDQRHSILDLLEEVSFLFWDMQLSGQLSDSPPLYSLLNEKQPIPRTY